MKGLGYCAQDSDEDKKDKLLVFMALRGRGLGGGPGEKQVRVTLTQLTAVDSCKLLGSHITALLRGSNLLVGARILEALCTSR